MSKSTLNLLIVLFLICPGFAWGCQQSGNDPTKTTGPEVAGRTGSPQDEVNQSKADEKTGEDSQAAAEEKKMETVTLGAGCFWCVEAVFDSLKGVESVESGYMGGTLENPSYAQVCEGWTGHAEVCKVVFDPEEIEFAKLLEVFWSTHDPTTLNAQGPDHGTQYRSAIFFTTDEQRQIAEQLKEKINAGGFFNVPIVTEITAYSTFYPAEDYHQEYFALNGKAPYCRSWIAPKMKKFRKAFADLLKDEENEKAKNQKSKDAGKSAAGEDEQDKSTGDDKTRGDSGGDNDGAKSSDGSDG